MSEGYKSRPLSATKQRELRVLELRAKGMGFEAIAAECGYANKSSAWKAYQRALKMTDRSLTDEQARLLELNRLDMLFEPMFEAATKERDPAAARVALRISDSRVKLLGLAVAGGRTRGFGDEDEDDGEGVVVGPDTLDRLREDRARREAERSSGG